MTVKELRHELKIVDANISDHTKFLWTWTDPENLTDDLVNVSWQGGKLNEVSTREDAEKVIKNQETFLKGADCSCPAITHNGMGIARCRTCGHYFAQSTNGNWPGL